MTFEAVMSFCCYSFPVNIDQRLEDGSIRRLEAQIAWKSSLVNTLFKQT